MRAIEMTRDGVPTQEWLEAWLDARFGHADYLHLNRLWKEQRFSDVAREIRLMFDMQPAPTCRASRDGDCTWQGCPQRRDGEPQTSGRHCPLDVDSEED